MKNKGDNNMRINTQSPYESLKTLNKETDSDKISLEEKKLRLECIRAAIVTGVKEPDIVVAAASRFWEFIQFEEKA